ncbi:MAG TPA: hypothetical protein VFS12_02645, partial [Terriglobia bacterium]|nr:hypothetical protein [Terriglobia bacterium]
LSIDRQPFNFCGTGLVRLLQKSSPPWNVAQTLSEALCGDGSSDPSLEFGHFRLAASDSPQSCVHFFLDKARSLL